MSKNIALAFPKKTETEVDYLIKESYKNLTDIMVESFKAFSMSVAEIKKRYIIERPSFIDDLYNSKKNIALFASHYGNWEWATYTFPLFYDYDIIGMVKPVKNKFINAYTNRKRCSTGTKVISIYSKNRSILSKPENPFILVYIADQNPSDDKNSLIIDFFDTKTYCLHGMEKAARKNNWPVVYLETKRVKRGYYRLTPTLITDNPGSHAPNEITQICFNKLEQQLKDSPSAWLWTHKRWKRNIKY